MTARRDLTQDEWRLIRARAADRVSKKAVAAELGISPKALTDCARRDGCEAEFRELFPVNPHAINAFTLTEAHQNKVRKLVSAGMNSADIAEHLGIRRDQLSNAIKKAGMADEVAKLRELAKARIKAHGKTLPRDIDPAVHWLTRAWRKCA